MPKKRFVSGVIDVVTIIGVLFLIVTLGVGTYVISDKKYNFNIFEKAAILECFPAGTKITTIGGIKNIEEFDEGDKVLSENEDGTKEVSSTQKLWKLWSFNMCSISFESGEKIKLTNPHPLYTSEGWKAINVKSAKEHNPDLDISQLTESDSVKKQNGSWDKITSISCEYGLFRVYNLAVDNNNNYYAEGFLAHNKGGGPGIIVPQDEIVIYDEVNEEIIDPEENNSDDDGGNNDGGSAPAPAPAPAPSQTQPASCNQLCVNNATPDECGCGGTIPAGIMLPPSGLTGSNASTYNDGIIGNDYVGIITGSNLADTPISPARPPAPAAPTSGGGCSADGATYPEGVVAVYSSGANDYRYCGSNGWTTTCPDGQQCELADVTLGLQPVYLEPQYQEAVETRLEQERESCPSGILLNGQCATVEQYIETVDLSRFGENNATNLVTTLTNQAGNTYTNTQGDITVQNINTLERDEITGTQRYLDTIIRDSDGNLINSYRTPLLYQNIKTVEKVDDGFIRDFTTIIRNANTNQILNALTQSIHTNDLAQVVQSTTQQSNTTAPTQPSTPSFWDTVKNRLNNSSELQGLGTYGLGGGNAYVAPVPMNIIESQNNSDLYNYMLGNTLSTGAGFALATLVTPGAPMFVFETATSIPGVLRALTAADIADNVITGAGCALGSQESCSYFQSTLFIPAPTGVGNMLVDSFDDFARVWRQPIQSLDSLSFVGSVMRLDDPNLGAWPNVNSNIIPDTNRFFATNPNIPAGFVQDINPRTNMPIVRADIQPEMNFGLADQGLPVSRSIQPPVSLATTDELTDLTNVIVHDITFGPRTNLSPNAFGPEDPLTAITRPISNLMDRFAGPIADLITRNITEPIATRIFGDRALNSSGVETITRQPDMALQEIMAITETRFNNSGSIEINLHSSDDGVFVPITVNQPIPGLPNTKVLDIKGYLADLGNRVLDNFNESFSNLWQNSVYSWTDGFLPRWTEVGTNPIANFVFGNPQRFAGTLPTPLTTRIGDWVNRNIGNNPIINRLIGKPEDISLRPNEAGIYDPTLSRTLDDEQFFNVTDEFNALRKDNKIDVSSNQPFDEELTASVDEILTPIRERREIIEDIKKINLTPKQIINAYESGDINEISRISKLLRDNKLDPKAVYKAVIDEYTYLLGVREADINANYLERKNVPASVKNKLITILDEQYGVNTQGYTMEQITDLRNIYLDIRGEIELDGIAPNIISNFVVSPDSWRKNIQDGITNFVIGDTIPISSRNITTTLSKPGASIKLNEVNFRPGDIVMEDGQGLPIPNKDINGHPVGYVVTNKTTGEKSLPIILKDNNKVVLPEGNEIDIEFGQIDLLGRFEAFGNNKSPVIYINSNEINIEITHTPRGILNTVTDIIEYIFTGKKISNAPTYPIPEISTKTKIVDINDTSTNLKPEITAAIKWANERGITVVSTPELGKTDIEVYGHDGPVAGVAYPERNIIAITNDYLNRGDPMSLSIFYHEAAGHILGPELPPTSVANRIINEILAQRAASLMLTKQGIKANPASFANVYGFIERFKALTGKDPYPIIDAIINTQKIQKNTSLVIIEPRAANAQNNYNFIKDPKNKVFQSDEIMVIDNKITSHLVFDKNGNILNVGPRDHLLPSISNQLDKEDLFGVFIEQDVKTGKYHLIYDDVEMWEKGNLETLRSNLWKLELLLNNEPNWFQRNILSPSAGVLDGVKNVGLNIRGGFNEFPITNRINDFVGSDTITKTTRFTNLSSPVVVVIGATYGGYRYWESYVSDETKQVVSDFWKNITSPIFDLFDSQEKDENADTTSINSDLERDNYKSTRNIIIKNDPAIVYQPKESIPEECANLELLNTSVVGANTGIRYDESFAPDVVTVNDKIEGARFSLWTDTWMVEEAVDPVQEWVSWINKQGYSPFISSAYRSYETQDAYSSSYGNEAATAGGSCHQSGLCFDVHYFVDNKTGVLHELCYDPNKPECKINIDAQIKAQELGIAHPYEWDQPHYFVAVAASPAMVPFVQQQSIRQTYIDSLNDELLKLQTKCNQYVSVP